MEVIKFLIPFTIFLLAIFNLLFHKRSIKKQYGMLFIASLFGLFNGIGTSNSLVWQLQRYESELLPILEVTLGAATAIFLLILGLLAISILAKNLIKIPAKVWVLGCSIVIICLSVPLIFSELFRK